jgi:hypothetical protein
MRSTILLLTLTITTLLSVACGSNDQSKSDTANGAQAMPTATIKQSSSSSTATAPSTTTDNGAPVSVAHGAPPASNTASSSTVPQGGPDTSALDKKIEQVEAKAKAPNAKPADKQAAAAAYVERANVFYNAGQPMLYKFALRDFRLALRYDPDNTEAREKRDQIVAIYQQMGRPVPDLGNEP